MRLRVVFAFSLWLILLCPLAGCAQDGSVDRAEVTRQAEDALAAGRYEEARSHLETLLDGDLDSTAVAVSYAETFLAVGEYGEGLEQIAAYLKKAPDDPFLRHAQGRLFQAVGRYEEAEDVFRQVRHQQPDFWHNTLRLAEVLEHAGRRRAAESMYEEIYNASRSRSFRTVDALSAAGRAAARIEEYHDANEAFRTAYRLDQEDVTNLYWWAELFREKYNEADARRTYEEALELNPRHADLFVGYAHAVGDFRKQEELVQRALEVNPASVRALTKLAELRIMDGQYDLAEEALDHALDINPNAVSALAHRASIHHLQGDDAAFQDVEERALGVSGSGGTFYLTVAENCARRYRYPDALEFSRRALFADNGSVEAMTQYGLNLLRMGHGQRARQYLSSGFDRDPFNLFVGNTLTLLDEYADFDTLEGDHVRVIIHNSESAVLGPKVLDVAETTLDSLMARYPYSPDGKVQVEAYRDADDFAVRVAGVPHLGLLGVSFGDVVAFQTPQPGQQQNWARTLWHELAHTVAIGVSDYRVPRWFTEGLSVYEEQRAQPAWGREMDLKLLAAFEQDRLLPLTEIDRGFTRPTFPGQVMLSYYHASKVIGLLVETHGFEVVVDLLRTLREGKDIGTAMQTVTGQDLQAVDEAFHAHLREQRKQMGGVLDDVPGLLETGDGQAPVEDADASEGSFLQALQQGNEALRNEDYDAAENHFRASLDRYPDYVDDSNAYEGLADVYRARENRAALMDILEQYLSRSAFGAEAARELAALHRREGRPRHAIRYLERSLEVDPRMPDVHRDLAALYEQQGQYDSAARARRAVIALDPVDRAEAYYRLAWALYRARRTEEAKEAVLYALEEAPGYREAQKLLLRCVEAL